MSEISNSTDDPLERTVDARRRVAIIGGGACGTLLAIHLLRRTCAEVHLIERTGPFGPGIRSAACLGANRLQTLFLVILPAALPLILAGLRQSIAISLIVLVAAELSGATAGVAYMMSMGHQLFRVDIMFIGLLLLGLLGFLADRCFVYLSQKLFPWYATFR